jgi:hypothetical protein
MMNSAVFANNVVRAHLAVMNSKSVQSLRTAIFSSMMNDYKIRFAKIEIGGSNPLRFFSFKRIFFYFFRKCFCLLPVILVGSGVFVGRAGSNDNKNESAGSFKFHVFSLKIVKRW